nr:MAG TPA: hypothetical protein [Bacteriophage sp.]
MASQTRKLSCFRKCKRQASFYFCENQYTRRQYS